MTPLHSTAGQQHTKHTGQTTHERGKRDTVRTAQVDKQAAGTQCSATYSLEVTRTDPSPARSASLASDSACTSSGVASSIPDNASRPSPPYETRADTWKPRGEMGREKNRGEPAATPPSSNRHEATAGNKNKKQKKRWYAGRRSHVQQPWRGNPLLSTHPPQQVQGRRPRPSLPP